MEEDVEETMTTILVADDEPSLRLLVSGTLRSSDYTLVEAADGDEAWHLLQESHPAVALLDVQMPGKTGLDLTKAIKSDVELSSTYVVLLTSKAQAADVSAGLKAGAERYLTKPFSPRVLREVVQAALKSRQDGQL